MNKNVWTGQEPYKHTIKDEEWIHDVIQMWIPHLASYKFIYLYYHLIDNSLFRHEGFMVFLNKDILSLLYSLALL